MIKSNHNIFGSRQGLNLNGISTTRHNSPLSFIRHSLVLYSWLFIECGGGSGCRCHNTNTRMCTYTCVVCNTAAVMHFAIYVAASHYSLGFIATRRGSCLCFVAYCKFYGIISSNSRSISGN